MKKTLQIFIIVIFISNFLFSQTKKNVNDNIKYFDENYNSISKREFEKRKKNNILLSLQGDSINHKILHVREIHGTLKNRNHLDSLLTLSTRKKIDSTKPLVIIYYPGKDPCNSSGSATSISKRIWYEEMEIEINKIRESNIVYVYKKSDELFRKKNKYTEWIKDPEQTIERLFFNRHYPCSSFVVISEKANFISYFGEFPKEFVWRSVEVLTDK